MVKCLLSALLFGKQQSLPIYSNRKRRKRISFPVHPVAGNTYHLHFTQQLESSQACEMVNFFTLAVII
jgi:hypothetical protein